MVKLLKIKTNEKRIIKYYNQYFFMDPAINNKILKITDRNSNIFKLDLKNKPIFSMNLVKKKRKIIIEYIM